MKETKPLKHDNCKDCIRNCEHAGKDREFCYKDVSCKKVGDRFVNIRKETAKEFAEKLKKKFDGYEATYYNGVEEGWHDLQGEIDELLKQYGVEVEK